jgi:hypothetical protein
MSEQLQDQPQPSSLERYTFTGSAGGYTSVMAPNEFQARDLAMYERWGEPDGIVTYRRPYNGYGLILISQDIAKALGV